MPLTANQQFNALTADSTLGNITVTTAATIPAVDGLSIAINTGVTDQDLWAVESMIGLFRQAEAYLLSELASLLEDGGGGVVIAVSIGADGAITRDALSIFAIKVGVNVADASASHIIDAMFKLCIAKLLETSKDGYTPVV